MGGFAWPAWIGTPSQFALLVVITGSIMIAYIKGLPKLLELRLGARTKEREEFLDRIRELKNEVKDCRRECDEQERRLLKKIEFLQNKINNEAAQRVQSEISLVNTLIQVVDAPQLKVILSALERRQMALISLKVREIEQEGAEDNERLEDEGP